MPTVTAVKFEVIPTGEYPVQVVDINEAENRFDPEKPQLQWTFEIIGKGAFVGKQMKAWTSLSPSLKGKFMNWAGVLLGSPIGEGDDLDTDDLIGKRALAVVVVKRKDDGTEFSKMEDLRTPPKAKATTAKPAAPAPAVPEKDTDDGDDPFAFD